MQNNTPPQHLNSCSTHKHTHPQGYICESRSNQDNQDKQIRMVYACQQNLVVQQNYHNTLFLANNFWPTIKK